MPHGKFAAGEGDCRLWESDIQFDQTSKKHPGFCGFPACVCVKGFSLWGGHFAVVCLTPHRRNTLQGLTSYLAISPLFHPVWYEMNGTNQLLKELFGVPMRPLKIPAICMAVSILSWSSHMSQLQRNRSVAPQIGQSASNSHTGDWSKSIGRNEVSKIQTFWRGLAQISTQKKDR